jgi:trimeric autotransporter adhesin
MSSLFRINLALLFVMQVFSSGIAQSGTITTYVGPQLPENGSQADTQSIDRPSSVAPDGSGGFYVASSSQNRVYRVTADGRLSLAAGNGIYGFSGDGGPATSAQLAAPSGITVDTAGNLFIADQSNHRIRMVTTSGVISTIAGNGIRGFNGDSGQAASAMLNQPTGVVVDSAGNLFIADTSNNRVRKIVKTSGGIITVAGGGPQGLSDGGPATSAQLINPTSVAVDTAGNLFIADTNNNRIRKVTSAGVISTVAGNGNVGFSGDGGPAASAQLSSPSGVAVDNAGNLFIADKDNHCVRKVTPSGAISTVTGGGVQGLGDGGPADSAKLYSPASVAVDTAGNLFIADIFNNRVHKVMPDGLIRTVAGNGSGGFSGDGGPIISAQLDSPTGVAMDTSGNLFIADFENQRVRKITKSGVISTVAGNGTGGFSGDGGPATAAQLWYPRSVAVDTAGNLFIADMGNNRIRRVTPGGVISTVAGSSNLYFINDGGPATSATLALPAGVAMDTAGNLLIADSGNMRIRKVTPDGVINTVAGNGIYGFSGDGGSAASAKLCYPNGIAVDTAGNLFIADYGNSRIRKVTPGGVINTVAGGGTQGLGDGSPAIWAQLNSPTSVAIDIENNLFIADTGNHRIYKVTPGGSIYTVTGNGIQGFNGDGGPAALAQLNFPSGITVDNAGNLFIADTYNNRIRKIVKTNVATNLNVSAGGNATAGTEGLNDAVQSGYATTTINSGSAPYGTAVFSYKQNGVTVTETGVPASPPTKHALLFIDYRSSVAAIPARVSSGIIDINTGIAAVNAGIASATITFTLRSMAGAALSTSHGTLAPGAHFAKFINQLKDIAPDFVLPADFQTATQFASLEISSDQPLSIIALRMTANQRNEALFTTTPIADLTKPTSNSAVFFPQFADGGGYTTSIVLLNTSNGIETGTLQIMDDNGNPFIVTLAGSSSSSSFKYSIPAGGAARFQTDGFPNAAKAGWVQLTPDTGTLTPAGAGVFSYNPGSFLITESGVPATVSTTHARIYVDLSGGHNTGLALANPAGINASITITAFKSDGTTGIGTSNGPLQLPAKGHGAHFADEFIAGLPDEFTGVLDIVSTTPFAALTIRSLINERNDFLMAAFPVADMTLAAPSPVVFPHIANGGGYVTQFILIGAGGASSTTLNYYADDGKPLAIGK